MAKVYNLYDPKGPEAKRQAKMHENNIAALANRHVVQPMVQPLVEPFKSAGRAAMQTGVGQDFTSHADARAVRSHNKAMGTSEAEMQRVAGPPPITSKAALGSAQASEIASQSPKLYKDAGTLGKNLSTLNAALAAGEATPEQAARIQALNARTAPGAQAFSPLTQQAGPQTLTTPEGGTLTYSGQRGSDRVPMGPDGRPVQMFQPNRTYQTDSGLSVQFDKGTPQSTIQAFMEPSGINDPKAQAARSLQHRQFLGRQGFQEVDPNALQKETAGMSMYQRQALRANNKNIMDQQKLGLDKSAEARSALKTQADLDLTAAQTAKYQQEVQAQQTEMQMQAILANPNSSPKAMETAKNYYKAQRAKTETTPRSHVFPGAVTDVWEDGKLISKQGPPTIVDPATGTFSEAQRQAPPVAMPSKEQARTYLDNPEMTQYFAEIFGMTLEDYLAE